MVGGLEGRGADRRAAEFLNPGRSSRWHGLPALDVLQPQGQHGWCGCLGRLCHPPVAAAADLSALVWGESGPSFSEAEDADA